MFKRIKEYLWAYKYKRAVRRANNIAQDFKITCYVLYFNKKLWVVPKKSIKKLIQQCRFKAGTTIQDIEKIALYIAK